ncbi:MAG: OmpA family protein [Bacteroidota bacterium]
MKHTCYYLNSLTVKLLAVGICIVITGMDAQKYSNKVYASHPAPAENELSKEDLTEIQKGDYLFSLGPLKYEYALERYLNVFKRKPNNTLINFKTGYCYLNISKHKSKSIEYFQRVANSDQENINSDIHYYLGQAYQANYNPHKAIEEFEKYIQELPNTQQQKSIIKTEFSVLSADLKMEAAKKRIQECKNWLHFSENPVKARIFNLGELINSPYPDYDPFASADESILIFNSRRPTTKGGEKAEIDGEYYEDIYISKRKNFKWEPPEKMGNINKSTNDAIVGLSHDGAVMLIYRDKNNGDIYNASLEGSKWSRIRKFKAINSKYHESSACLSPDQKTVYFVSDRPGGIGGRDIYLSKLDTVTNKWSSPENLGEPVNTASDEDRVFMCMDGKTFYFSSKGHNSMGGYDIFKSVYENGIWSKPENLGYPINDVNDDLSFTISTDLSHAYYSSYTQDGVGEKDIYYINFIIPKEDETASDSVLAPISGTLSEYTHKDSTMPFNFTEYKGNDSSAVIAKNDKKTVEKLNPLAGKLTPGKDSAELTQRNKLTPADSAVIAKNYKKTPEKLDPRTGKLTLEKDSTDLLQRNKLTPADSSVIAKNYKKTPEKLDPRTGKLTSGNDSTDLPQRNKLTIADSAAIAKNYKETTDLTKLNPRTGKLTPGNDSTDLLQRNKLTPADSAVIAKNYKKTNKLNELSGDKNNIDKEKTVIDPAKKDITPADTLALAKKDKAPTKTETYGSLEDKIYPKKHSEKVKQENKIKSDSIRETSDTDFELLDIPKFSNILFDFDKYNLKPESIITLEEILKYLNDNKHITIAVVGHTDAKGTDDYNVRLSERRVYAVAKYLVDHGIDEKRIHIDFRGETEPIAANTNPDGSDNPEGRRLNRRAAFELKSPVKK